MTVKVKIKDIKQNPFKKFINDGRLDESRVAKMIESIEHGTLPNIFFARKGDGKWELSHGHHRLGAFAKKYGKDFELNVNEVTYSDELMLVDMIRENLTHRDSDYQDKEASCILARAWLQSKSTTVKQFDSGLRKGGKSAKGLYGSTPLPDSCRSIAKFLSKEGKTISYETVRILLRIHDGLDKELHKEVGKKGHSGLETDGLSIRVAECLIGVDKNSQKNIAEKIKKEHLNQHNAAIAVNKFKEADEKVKEQVLKGKLKLSDVPAVIEQQNFEADVFDQTEPPEPDSTGKAIALQTAFDRAQSNWLDVISMLGSERTIKDCGFNKMEVKSFIKDISNTKEKEEKVIKALKEVAK